MQLISATEALKTKLEAHKVPAINKFWKPGDVLDIEVPIFWDANGLPQLAVGAVWGYKLSGQIMKTLKRTFWPTQAIVVDGVPQTADTAYAFARIAKAILEGDYLSQVNDIQTSGLSAKEMKLEEKKIDKEFKLDDEGRIGKSPDVGNLMYLIVTEAVICPMISKDGNLVPDTVKARAVSMELNQKKIASINALLRSPETAPQEGATSYWFRMSYGNDEDKAEAGKVSPTGLHYSETIPFKFPEEFIKMKDISENLPDDSDMIMKRNSAFIKGNEKDMISAIQSFYVRNEKHLLGYMHAEAGSEEEKENDLRLRSLAKSLKALKIPVKNPTILDEMELIAEDLFIASGEEEGKTADGAIAGPSMTALLTETSDIQEAIAAAEAGNNSALDAIEDIEGM